MNKMLIFSSIIVFAFLSKAETVDKVVAIVNNEPILESDFKVLNKKLSKSNSVDDSLLINYNLEQLKSQRSNQKDYLINEKIIDSEIKRLNLQVTQERVEKELRELAKRNNVSQEELVQILEQQGYELSEYREFLKTRIERQSLMQNEIISKLRVSDEDAYSEYLKQNPQSSQTIDEFSLSHIFFNPKKGGEKAAIDRAQVALDKLKAGGAFDTLAEQFSEDPNFTTGGFLGSFKSGEFLPEVESEIKHLQANQTSNIIKSKLGFHIVKVISKKVTIDPKFEKEKEGLKSSLIEKNFKRQFKIWLEAKKEDAYIRTNEKDISQEAK